MRSWIINLCILFAFTSHVKAQFTLVPDSAFRNYLVQNYSSVMSKNQTIIDSLATKLIGGMDCSGKGISSLAGLEKFTSLSALNCSNNRLTSLDQVKVLTRLNSLYCNKNQLISLPDLSKLTGLAYLGCSGNQLNSFPDLSNNVALTRIDCFENNINFIPGLDKLVNLTILDMYTNNIDSLPDLSKLSKLSEFQCYNNHLKTIPGLQNLSNLTLLIAGNNPIKLFPDLSKLTKLQLFLCWTCQLKSPPKVSSMTGLTLLDLNNNGLLSMPDVSQNRNLTELRFQDNLVDTLPGLKNLTSLKIFNIKNNKFRNLTDLSASASSLEELYVDSNNISVVPDFSSFSALKVVEIEKNKLTFEDLISLKKVKTLPDTSFTYAPQQKVSLPLLLNSAEHLLFVYSPGIDPLVKNNDYTWYKGAQSFSKSQVDTLRFSKISFADSGIYYLTVTNPAFPLLNLSSTGLSLKVLPCIDLSGLRYVTEEIDCEKAGTLRLDPSSIKGGKPPYHFILTGNISGRTYQSETGKFLGLNEKDYLLSITESSGCQKNLTVAIPAKDRSLCRNQVIVATGSSEAASLFLEEQGYAKVFDKEGKVIHSFNTPGFWDGSASSGETIPGIYLIEHNGKSFNVTVIK